MPISLQTLKRQHEKSRQLQLGFQDLTHQDVKRILTRLQHVGRSREQPPRKCRRLNDTLESAVIINISSSSNITKINLVGNTKLGDKVTEILHLLPDTVKDLDLSSCGLTTEGVKNIGEYMQTNTSITRLIMWGNNIDDEGAKCIGEMLKNNSTLKELCINNDCLEEQDPMSDIAKARMAPSLIKNRTLRILTIDHCINPIGPLTSFAFRSVLETVGNASAIEKLEIGRISENPDPSIPTKVREKHLNVCDWEEVFKQCENLKHLGQFTETMLKPYPSVLYWRNINLYNARRIARDGAFDKFQSAVQRAAKNGHLDVVYHLLRNNAGHISRA